MFFLLAAAIGLFTYFVVKTPNDSSYSQINQLVDKNYDLNILLFQRKIMESIIENMQNIDNFIQLNEVIFDSSIIKLELVLIEIENFKFDKDSTKQKFDMKYNQFYLELIIDSFEMILHFDSYLPFSKQISFQTKVQVNKILIGLTFSIKEKKMLLNQNWIQKFKIESFIYDVDSENQMAIFFQNQVNNYLQKHHKYFENQLLKIFEKEIQKSDDSFDLLPPDERIQEIQIIDSETLHLNIFLFKISIDNFVYVQQKQCYFKNHCQIV